MNKYLFTSESVTEGHPDKICDQISDSILDEIIKKDPKGRVACETCVTTGMVMVMGEISSKYSVDIQSIVRQTIRDIGYTDDKFGFDANTCGVITCIDQQSSDIALGVHNALENRGNPGAKDLGAGDQGMMFGFATDETEEFMPASINLAHRLARRLDYVRKKGILDYLGPDGKTQVTMEYDKLGRPTRVNTVVISAQHLESVSQEKIETDIKHLVLSPLIAQEVVGKTFEEMGTRILVNPTGKFVIGGPHGDSGLTGRKIIVDTYGGSSRHGGGAFSGKDCTKVDRSAAYAARYLAKNIVASKVAKKCEIQLSYAIGVAKPVSIFIDTFGTGRVSEEKLVKIINKNVDLRPSGIIKMFDLYRPIYRQTASYGHFGRSDLDLPWERLNIVHLFENL